MFLLVACFKISPRKSKKNIPYSEMKSAFCISFDHCNDCPTIIFTHNRINFPVTETLFQVDNVRSTVNCCLKLAMYRRFLRLLPVFKSGF
jgi:hypothetical protein